MKLFYVIVDQYNRTVEHTQADNEKGSWDRMLSDDVFEADGKRDHIAMGYKAVAQEGLQNPDDVERWNYEAFEQSIRDEEEDMEREYLETQDIDNEPYDCELTDWQEYKTFSELMAYS